MVTPARRRSRSLNCSAYRRSPCQVVAIDGSTVKVERQTDSGYDEVTVPLPALVTVTAGVVEPRYASFKGIMAAKSKPLEVLSVADLSLGAETAKPARAKRSRDRCRRGARLG